MKYRDWLVTVLPILLVLGICGMAMRATGRDSRCTEVGGHLEGMIKMECVIP